MGTFSIVLCVSVPDVENGDWSKSQNEKTENNPKTYTSRIHRKTIF